MNKKKFWLRILEFIVYTIVMFIPLSVFTKLIIKIDEWFLWSLCWSVASSVAVFVRPYLTCKNWSTKDTVIYRLIAIFILFFALAFVLGVLIGNSEWWYYSACICLACGQTLWFGHDPLDWDKILAKYKNKDCKYSQEKNTTDIQIETGDMTFDKS